jgi:small subunit ribosomal protein S2
LNTKDVSLVFFSFMQEITLQALLEAGCHFGHKAERWHPKAAEFIYTKKDGVHIIDLAKTKAGLEAACAYIEELVANGGEVLFVATKRQARGVVKEAVEKAGAPYLTERWIGGFLTNWDGVRKNIQKINRLDEEQRTDAWKKFPKHERTKLGHYLERIKNFYGGVLKLDKLPDALFVVDVKKEDSAVREAKRREIPLIAIVDTNANPEGVDYVIPANDDAVGSVQYLVSVAAQAYADGRARRQKHEAEAAKKVQKEEEKAAKAAEKTATPEVAVQ